MFEHIDPADPNERCGLLIAEPAIRHSNHTDVAACIDMIVELPNRHEDPENYFTVHKADVDRALEWLKLPYSHIAGFWHTHPGDSVNGPSQDDWDEITLGEKNWWHCVLHIDTGTITWFDYYDNEITEDKDSHGNVRVPVRTVRPQQQRARRNRVDRVH